MDHQPGRQLTSRGGKRLPWRELATGLNYLQTLRLDFGSSSLVDGPVHLNAFYQAGVGGIDDTAQPSAEEV